MYYQSQSVLSYQVYESVGALSMVMPDQIREEQNIGYLEDLCVFIDKMKINPLWYEVQNGENKAKLLQIYQIGINYSKNLSMFYQRQIDILQRNNKKLSEDIDMKIKKIKQHKEKVNKIKQKYKFKKYKKIKNQYHQLKKQIREQQELEQHYDRKSNEQHSYSEQYSHRNNPPYYIQPQYHQPPYGHIPYVNNNDIRTNLHSVNSHSTTVPHITQHPPLQGSIQQSFQQQLARNMFNLFPNGNNNNVPPQSTQTQNRQGLQIKQIDDSQQMEEQKQTSPLSPHLPQQQRQQILKSQIMSKGKIQIEQPSQPQKSIDQTQSRIIAKSKIIKPIQEDRLSSQASQCKMSISNQRGVNGEDDFDDIGELSAKSRIGPTSKNKLSSKNSRERINSEQEQQINSIAMMKLSPQSNINKNIKDPKKNQPNINGLELAQQSKHSPSSQDELSLPSNIMNSKFNRKKNPQTKPLHNKKPTRASHMNKKQQQQNEDIIENFDSIQLNPVSQISRKSEQKKEEEDDIEDFGMIMHSTKYKKQGKGFPSKNSMELKNSNRQQKQSNISGSLKGDIQKSNNQMQKSNTEGLDIPKSNKILQQQVGQPNSKSQDYGNIFRSNIGKRGRGEEEVREPEKPPSYQTKPKRASQIVQSVEQPQKVQSSKTPPKLQKPAINEQQQENYGNEPFQQDIDLGNLEVSHHPGTSKNLKSQEAPKQHGDPKSTVNVVLPSNKSLDELSKYVKLKDQVFVLKSSENRPSIQQTKIQRSSYQDPFDFIASIPANSVIAKRPVPQSKIDSKIRKQPTSLKNFSDKSIGGSSSSLIPSINLINPQHQKTKLVERQERPIISKSEKSEEPPSCVDMRGLALNSIIVKKQQPGPKVEQKEINKQKQKQKCIVKQKQKQKEQVQNNNKNKEDEQQQASYSDNSSGKYSILNRSLIKNKKQKPGKVDQSQQRNQILLLIKDVQNIQPNLSKKQKVDEKLIFKTLEEIAAFNFSDFNNVDKVVQTNRMLDKMIRELSADNMKKKAKIDKSLKQGKKQDKLPLNREKENGVLNDSLKYSQSVLKQPSKAIQKNIEVDYAESIDLRQVLQNPYTPQQPLPKRKESGQMNNDIKKQQKGNNRYLRQTKGTGSREQDSLLKNVGEGIIKYDQDDDLNREVMNLISLKKGKLRESGDADEWD